MQIARLCYAQPLNNGINTACEYSFEKNPFCHTYKIYLSIKDLEILAEFCLLQILHLCTRKSVCTTNFGIFEEIGANFSVQLTSQTQFAKIENKKVIPQNQCEKHKESSLCTLISTYH